MKVALECFSSKNSSKTNHGGQALHSKMIFFVEGHGDIETVSSMITGTETE